jgi:uncharacterized protein Usg
MRDLHYRIKDIEGELEWMYSREPEEKKYIDFLKRELDDAYHQVDIAIKEKKENEDE